MPRPQARQGQRRVGPRHHHDVDRHGQVVQQEGQRLGDPRRGDEVIVFQHEHPAARRLGQLVEERRQHRLRDVVTGFRDGWRGPLEADTVPLDVNAVRGILPRGGTVLGSSRTNPFKENGPGRNGVAAVIMPNDLAESDYQEPARAHGFTRSGAGYAPPRVVPHDAELRRAADLLNAGSKVAILIGQGARGARRELEEIAEVLGAGVAKALLGREVLPDDLPFVTGPIGLLGSMPSDEMVMNCDTFLMIGTSFPYAEWLPDEGSARGVEIDIDGSLIGMRYPMDAHLVGDARETLKLLNPMLRRKEDRSWRVEIEKNVRTWNRIMADRAGQVRRPVEGPPPGAGRAGEPTAAARHAVAAEQRPDAGVDEHPRAERPVGRPRRLGGAVGVVQGRVELLVGEDAVAAGREDSV